MERLHPITAFVYFLLVISFAITLLHPLLLPVSLAAAVSCVILRRGRSALRFLLGLCLPMALLSALINPLVNHRGATILFYLGRNAITGESLLFGLMAGAMLASVLCWFDLAVAVLDNEKLIYLFSRSAPALALLLSLTLRFLPLYRRQMTAIREARAGAGFGAEATRRGRLTEAGHIFQAMLSWSLESALETADSMRARGYGSGKRSNFHVFRFDARDRNILLLLILLAALLLAGALRGCFSYAYFPVVSWAAATPLFYTAAAAYLVLCFLPLFWLRRNHAKF